MALLDLYFDVTSKQLAEGLNGPVGVSLPTLRQEEGVSIALNVIKRLPTKIPPLFQRVNLAGYSLEISVAETPGTVLASQSSWDVSDAANGVLSGTLPLNTTGINNLSDNTQIYFEIRLYDGAYYYGKRFQTRVEKAVSTAGSPQPIAGDTALGSLEASRVYMRKEGRAGEGFILKSADGSKTAICYLDNDGSFRCEPVS